MFLAGFLIIFIFCMACIITWFYSSDTTAKQGYIYLAVTTVLSCLFGYVTMKYSKIGLACLGSVAGYVIGVIFFLVCLNWYVEKYEAVITPC